MMAVVLPMLNDFIGRAEVLLCFLVASHSSTSGNTDEQNTNTMIKIRKGNIVVLGITEENVNRLKKDQPIKFNMNELGFDDITVYICHGKDEQELYEQFKEGINPFKTIIKDSRSPKN